MVRRFLILWLVTTLSACGVDGVQTDDAVQPPQTPSVSGGDAASDAFVITSSDQLIGGPLADGRVGDIYIQNDKIRAVIQQPNITGAAFGGSAGGDLLDLDLVRGAGEPGQDNLLDVFPLLNFEWTVNYQTIEIIEHDLDQYGLVRVRATGVMDVQEWLTPSLIEGAMQSYHYKGLYPDRFKNILDPLNTDPQFAGLSQTVVTDYILRRGASYVEMQTTFTNEGSEPIAFPIGTWVGATGYMELFIPMSHFGNPYLEYKLSGNLPGLVYAQFKDGEADDTQVSYAYLYDYRSFAAIDAEAEEGTVVGVQGVAAAVPGQQVFKLSNDAPGLLPICESDTGAILVDCDTYGDSTIRAALPPGSFTFTSYLGVGSGSVSSALEATYSGMKVPYEFVSGTVRDASGAYVQNARISLVDEQARTPVTVFVSDESGAFSGKVPTGSGDVGSKLGSGKYSLKIYKEGYDKGDETAGACTPATIDVTAGTAATISCTLGSTVAIRLGDIFDADTGRRMPAQVTIAGFDLSPKTDVVGDVAGFYRVPHGVIDTLLYNPTTGVYSGQHRRPEGGRVLYMEPGTYALLYSRGTEYALEMKKITVTSGTAAVDDVSLERVVSSSGYLAMDFHIHSRDSLDVPIPEEQRALGAAAAGLDVFNSANHDVVTTYESAIESVGMSNWMNAWSGAEVTPLLMGHFLALGLPYDASSPEDGGSVSFLDDSRDTLDAGRDYNIPLQTLFDKIRDKPGEQVVLVAHILNHVLGYMSLNGLVTSPFFDTDPFSVFQDPAAYRLGDAAGEGPYAMGTVETSSLDFDGIELGVSTELHVLEDVILPAALPTAFNLFNWGKRAVMTVDNDGHLPIQEPMGNVRNYCRSDVDPADGAGSYPSLNTPDVRDAIFRNIKAQHCFITSGPYVTATISKGSESASYGDTLSLGATGSATLDLRIEAPSWIEWDTVDVYINTIPEPILTEGASDEDFHRGDLAYTMTPTYSYSTEDGSLSVSVEDGKRASTVSKSIAFTEDSWVVIVVRGHDGVSNPTFPINPVELDAEDSSNSRANLITTLQKRFIKADGTLMAGGAPTYAITNPISIDVDGDTNTDGDPWEAIFIRDGTSPLAR